MPASSSTLGKSWALLIFTAASVIPVGNLLAQTGQEGRAEIERLLLSFDQVAMEEPGLINALRANLALKRWIDDEKAVLRADSATHERAAADLAAFCSGSHEQSEFNRRRGICAVEIPESQRQGDDLSARRAELDAKDAARLQEANALRVAYETLRKRAKSIEDALAAIPAFVPVGRACAPETGIQAKGLCLSGRWADTSEHDRRFPEPPSPTGLPKNRALIGGQTWLFGEYAMNVPQGLTGEAARQARLESEKQFFGRLELAGIPKDRFIAPESYNFIIGVAQSSGVIGDLPRVYADNLSRGRATPAVQKEYNLLRGRTFDALDCHSNGAMLCLAGLANNDIKLVEPRVVRLMGPQITPAALEEWQRLAQSRNIDLRIYFNDGDPVPRISYMASYLTPNSNSLGQRLGAIPNVLKEAVFGTGLKDQIEKEVPAAKVYSFSCSGSDSFRYSISACHDLRTYQRNVP